MADSRRTRTGARHTGDLRPACLIRQSRDVEFDADRGDAASLVIAMRFCLRHVTCDARLARAARHVGMPIRLLNEA